MCIRDSHVTVNGGRNILEYENRTADDQQVAQHDDPPVTDRLVTVDDHRDDIRAAGAAALRETDADTAARHGSAENYRQQLVVAESE